MMPKRLILLVVGLAAGVAVIAAVLASRSGVAPSVAPPAGPAQVTENTAGSSVAAPTSDGVLAPDANAPTPPTSTRQPIASVPETSPAVREREPRAAREPGPPTPKRGAPEMSVAVLLGREQHGDTSLNDAVRHGLALARKHGRLRISEHRSSRPGALLHELAMAAPALVIAVGEPYTDAVRAVSDGHPDLRVLLLDGALADRPAVQSVTFRGDEGAFLAGVAAAAETQRGVVGMIGAMHTPALAAFECAWETGVRWGTKEAFRLVRGVVLYLGTTPEAFARPAEAEVRSRELIDDKGVDVIVAAAGRSGAGVLEAARRARIKAIGVDTDLDDPSRDVLITSIRKRVDRIVETAVADIRRGTFRGGASVMNLSNSGVEVAFEKVSPATKKLVDKARARIVAGRMDVCVKEEDRVPAWNFPPRPQG